MKRHTTDALGYYIEEIHWFNLIFVTIFIHIISIQSNLASYNQTSESMKFVYSGLMITQRLLQLYFLMPLKDSSNKFTNFPKKVWVGFACIEVIGLGITATFGSYRGITAATSIIEIFVFIGQYIYCFVNQKF